MCWPLQTPERDVFESTSTELTQSSCSNDALYDGGMSARTYSTSRVVSADMPFSVRYSSIVDLRNEPLMMNSKGTGLGDSSIVFTRVERA